MKNAVFNIKKKWEGTLEGTFLGQTVGGRGSSLRDDQAQEEGNAEAAANQLVEGPERAVIMGANHQRGQPQKPQQEHQPVAGRTYVNNADGILEA